MTDDGSLLHGIIALFVPGAWAVVLYPYCRLWRKDWRIMLMIALGFSLVSMLVKELFDARISTNDVVADLLGLFFGTTLVAAVLTAGGKRLSRRKFSAAFNRKISLRELLAIAKRIELQAASFYEGVSLGMFDPKVKEGCLTTAGAERKHAENIQKVLGGWLPRPPDPGLLNSIEKELKDRDLFTRYFPRDASVQDVLKYAIEMESKLGEFYSSFQEIFPVEWKKEYVRRLVREEGEHKQRMTDLLYKMS